jgi:hypothetical protein
MSSSLPGRWGNHLGEPRVSFIPGLNALVILPDDNNRIQVRHFNLKRILAEKEDYLFVLSFPETRAVAGKAYRYRVDARSRRSGLRYELKLGPNGMTVSNGGEILWKPEISDVGKQFDVILQIQSPSGQESLQAFQVEVE